MVMTNAQRQARYKSRQRMRGNPAGIIQGESQERLDMWISSRAAHGLRVLAQLHESSIQAELDRVLLAAIQVTRAEAGQDRWFAAAQVVLDGPVTR